jgi:clan AA aspartic protease
MTRGVVTRFKARIPLRVRGANAEQVTIEAAVDTGFNGMLTLPLSIISSLELEWESESRGTLADGTMKKFDVYRATVVWHGRARKITVSALDMYPVIGMGLLDGSELNIKVRPGGEVTIKPLRRR